MRVNSVKIIGSRGKFEFGRDGTPGYIYFSEIQADYTDKACMASRSIQFKGEYDRAINKFAIDASIAINGSVNDVSVRHIRSIVRLLITT